MTPRDTLHAPGLGHSQRAILEALKRQGRATTPGLATQLRLNVETVRGHLRSLLAEGLVSQAGSVRTRPGRPETLFALTGRAEALFPRLEGEVLQEFARHLGETGQQGVIDGFYREWIAERREAALGRLAGMEGTARVEELARILSEWGYMASVEQAADGPRLRLSHCPVRALVAVSMVPCRAEVGLITELLGEKLTRVSYIPSGHATCSYRLAARPKAGADEPVYRAEAV
jgi:predicted ArsR family transcriptional regulator